MREHGNAFLILFMECQLATIAAVAIKLKIADNVDEAFILSVVVLALWIFPGGIAWYVASHLEMDLAESPIVTPPPD
jgi:hypothetical protein